MIATIDDHELSDNAWLGGAQEHDDAKDGPWIDRSNAAMTRLERLDADVASPGDGRPRLAGDRPR